MKLMRALHGPATLFLCGFLTLSETGCGTFKGPEDIKAMTEKFQTIQGTLVAPPVLDDGGRRLFLYVQRKSTADGVKETLVMVAINKDNKGVLQRLARAVPTGTEQPIFVYARPVNGKWKEFVSGVDYEIGGVGYYNRDADRYMTVLTAYGDSLTDVLKNAGWEQFMIEVGKMAIKGAMKGV